MNTTALWDIALNTVCIRFATLFFVIANTHIKECRNKKFSCLLQQPITTADDDVNGVRLCL
jgi:hypothetical protein